MFGLKIGRALGTTMEPGLRHGTFAVFYRTRRVRRSDVVLVDHPELGKVVKRVQAVSVHGRLALRSVYQRSEARSSVGYVDRDQVLGKLAFRIPFSHILPRFSKRAWILTERAPDTSSEEQDDFEHEDAGQDAA